MGPDPLTRPGMAKSILFCLAMACASSLISPIWAANRSWTGNASGFWSNPNNWNPSGPPEEGEALIFGAFFNRSMVNDLVGLRLDSLVFDHFDYVLSGNALTLGVHPNDAVIEMPMGGGAGSATINCALILGTNRCIFDCTPFREDGSATLRINADINLNGFDLTFISFPGGVGGDAKIEIAGSISGNGNVTVFPADPDRGSIEFIGSAENTFSGTLRVSSGGSEPDSGVYFNKQGGSVANNRLELARGVTVDVQRPHQIGDGATVCIMDGSRLLFHGNTETIGNLCFTNSAADTEPSLVDTDGSTLSVNGEIRAVNNSVVQSTIRGKLGLPPGSHTIDVSGTTLTA